MIVTRWVIALRKVCVAEEAGDQHGRCNKHQILSCFIALPLKLSFGTRRRSYSRLLLCHRFVETTKIPQHYGSGISSGTARNRSTRMCGRTSLIEPRNWHAMLRPAGGRPQCAARRSAPPWQLPCQLRGLRRSNRVGFDHASKNYRR
jgi:hypothetical protein